MSEALAGSLITAVASLLGIMISSLITSKKQEAALRTAQAVTDTKITELTREVREHNNFARRMPVVEEKILNLERRLERIAERSEA